jgi:hypothetical protein
MQMYYMQGLLNGIINFGFDLLYKIRIADAYLTLETAH